MRRARAQIGNSTKRSEAKRIVLTHHETAYDLHMTVRSQISKIFILFSLMHCIQKRKQNDNFFHAHRNYLRRTFFFSGCLDPDPKYGKPLNPRHMTVRSQISKIFILFSLMHCIQKQKQNDNFFHSHRNYLRRTFFFGVLGP
jgi:uncharacterized membrane protein